MRLRVIYSRCTLEILTPRAGVGRPLGPPPATQSASCPARGSAPPLPANIINAAIKIFVLILTSESQLINKKGNEKLKNKLDAAVGLDVSQLRLTASFNFTSMNRSHRPQLARQPLRQALFAFEFISQRYSVM